MTVNSVEQKRVLMDLDISMRSADCPFTVQFYGALFREGDVWICMEVMDTSLDKFYPKVYNSGGIIPESILQKITYAVRKEVMVVVLGREDFYTVTILILRAGNFP